MRRTDGNTHSKAHRAHSDSLLIFESRYRREIGPRVCKRSYNPFKYAAMSAMPCAVRPSCDGSYISDLVIFVTDAMRDFAHRLHETVHALDDERIAAAHDHAGDREAVRRLHPAALEAVRDRGSRLGDGLHDDLCRLLFAKCRKVRAEVHAVRADAVLGVAHGDGPCEIQREQDTGDERAFQAGNFHGIADTGSAAAPQCGAAFCWASFDVGCWTLNIGRSARRRRGSMRERRRGFAAPLRGAKRPTLNARGRRSIQGASGN